MDDSDLDSFNVSFIDIVKNFLGLLILILVLLQGFSLTDLRWIQEILVLVLRTAVIAALALALTRPRTVSEHRKVCTIFLVDVSDSVSPEQLVEAQRYIEEVYRRRGENLVQLVTFAQRPRKVDIPEKGPVPALEHLMKDGTYRRGREAHFDVTPLTAYRSDMLQRPVLAHGCSAV